MMRRCPTSRIFELNQIHSGGTCFILQQSESEALGLTIKLMTKILLEVKQI